MKLGLCCQFYEHPIKYRSATFKVAKSKGREYLNEIYKHNTEALMKSLEYCFLHGIQAFRVSSDLFPLATHPEIPFTPMEMSLSPVREYAAAHGLILSLHPDQFVVLNSPKPEVVANSIRELTYQVKIADLIGAEQVTLHAGGVYADKVNSLERLIKVVNQLPNYIKRFLCFENDDKSYTPEDIVSICEATGCRFIYDVHHHRFNPDSLSVSQATILCQRLWFYNTVKTNGWVHISSSRNGLSAHNDYINPADFPVEWKQENIIVDVEAKAKENAVLLLQKQLNSLIEWHNGETTEC